MWAGGALWRRRILSACRSPAARPPRSRPAYCSWLRRCTGGDDEPAPEAEPSTPSTPLESYAADTVVLQRAPFCERIPASAVEEALDGEATKGSAYDNGERARISEDVRDVAHEYGCDLRGRGRHDRPRLAVRTPGHPATRTAAGQAGAGRPGLHAGARGAGVRPALGRPGVRVGRRADRVVPRAVRRRLAELRGRACPRATSSGERWSTGPAAGASRPPRPPAPSCLGGSGGCAATVSKPPASY